MLNLPSVCQLIHLALATGTTACFALNLNEGVSTIGYQNASPEERLLLKGEVRSLDSCMREVSEVLLSAKRLRERAHDLYEEATRRPLSVDDADFLDLGYSSIPIFAEPRGEFLPMRKKWVNTCMQEIILTLSLLKYDVDSALKEARQFDARDDISDELAGLRQEAFSVVRDSHKYQLLPLEYLTAREPYDNEQIACLAKDLYDNMLRLEGLSRRMLKIMRAERKTVK